MMNKEIWAIFKRHPDVEKMLSGASLQMRSKVAHFVETSDEILAGVLEAPANPRSILEAQGKFQEHILERMGLEEDRKKSLLAEIRNSQKNLFERLSKISRKKEMHLMREIGLNAENQNRFESENLTIGEILHTQPEMLLFNVSPPERAIRPMR